MWTEITSLLPHMSMGSASAFLPGYILLLCTLWAASPSC